MRELLRWPTTFLSNNKKERKEEKERSDSDYKIANKYTVINLNLSWFAAAGWREKERESLLCSTGLPSF